MARIRTIKPEFWQDEKLAPLSPTTRLVFLGLISMADDAGRVHDNTKIIDAFIFPETSETSRGSVGELSATGRIVRGKTASGQRVIQIANWTRHQRIEKPNLQSALPEIVEVLALTGIPGSVADESPTNRGSVGDASPPRSTIYDLRSVPTTDDLSSSDAATKKPSRSRKPVTDRVGGADWPADWVGQITDLIRARFGAFGYARVAKSFANVNHLAWAQVLALVTDSTMAAKNAHRDKGKPLVWTPEAAVQASGYWVDLATRCPDYDRAGVLTERGRAVGMAA